MNAEWTAILREQPALDEIPAALRDTGQLRSFAAGQTLYRRGERPKAMLCLLSGEIRLIRRTPRGAEIVLQRVRGGFVAEASMESKAYHCDVVAVADGRLLAFPITAFQAALEHDAAFRSAWIRRLAQDVRRLRAQNERLSLNSAAERILHFIEAEGVDGRVSLTQSRKAWAAELGLTHEVLYRTLRRLRQEGILTIDGDEIALARL
jgi:CRP-like cAMP-binding protein